MDSYLNNKIIKNHYAREVEPHEVLLDKLAQRKEKEMGISEKKIETPLMRAILYGFFIGIAVLLSLLFIRTFQLQILKTSLSDLEDKIAKEPDLLIEISQKLDHQTLIILETKIKEFPGFWIENRSSREYLAGEDLAHILGYLGKIKQE